MKTRTKTAFVMTSMTASVSTMLVAFAMAQAPSTNVVVRVQAAPVVFQYRRIEVARVEIGASGTYAKFATIEITEGCGWVVVASKFVSATGASLVLTTLVDDGQGVVIAGHQVSASGAG